MNITQLLQQYKDNNFSWGTMDCCVFAGELAEKINEKPLHLENWRDFLDYSNMEESKKTIKELGGKKMKDLPSIILGTPIKNISEVKHGDIVYSEDENGDGMLGVCNGVRAYFMAKGKGITARPVTECISCWSIN